MAVVNMTMVIGEYGYRELQMREAIRVFIFERKVLMCKINRCPWAGELPVYVNYHDNEWGRPVHDDNKLFEMLILEGMQAGLNWITVLKKREAFREAFDGFDPGKIALYGEGKKQELLENEGIIRNRLKVNAAVTNSRVFQELDAKG